LPEIQADQVGIIGFSHGGSGALMAAEADQAPTIKVYAGAVHGFDVPDLDRRSSSGHLMRGYPSAAAASFAETRAFLDARLKAR
jgi:dienelactone hydrolase